MSLIRSRGNKNTELRLISVFRTYGITGWRRNSPLPGKPDFVFPRERLAIFVDGCFWHGCKRHCRMPKSRLEYWIPKKLRNRLRDKEATKAPAKTGLGGLSYLGTLAQKPGRIIATSRGFPGDDTRNA